MVAKGYKFGDGAQEGVDVRLDNRQGWDRPVAETDPAVPQQVDGPDVVHQQAHADAVEKLRTSEALGKRRGMNAPGDHSLGDEAERGGNDAGQADKLKETDPASESSAPTDAKKNKDAVGG